MVYNHIAITFRRFEMNFTLGGILMFSAFAVLLIIMAVTVSRAAGFSKKNVSLPRISAPAKVVSKRTFSMSKDGKAYFMTFEFKTGDRAEYRVSDDAYLYFAEGDEGTVTVRGTEFISFVI